MVLDRWFSEPDPSFVQLMGVSVPELFQPQAIHLEVGLFEPLLVAHVKPQGIVSLFYASRMVSRGHFSCR